MVGQFEPHSGFSSILCPGFALLFPPSLFHYIKSHAIYAPRFNLPLQWKTEMLLISFVWFLRGRSWVLSGKSYNILLSVWVCRPYTCFLFVPEKQCLFPPQFLHFISAHLPGVLTFFRANSCELSTVHHLGQFLTVSMDIRLSKSWQQF